MRVTLNLDDDVHRDVKFIASQTGLTMGEVITIVLRKHYEMPNEDDKAKRLLAYLGQPDLTLPSERPNNATANE